jgi:cytochrome c oxidase cbb3-type subunit I/II
VTADTTADSGPVVEDLPIERRDAAARLHFIVSSFFGFVALLLYLLNALQLVWPDLGSGSAFLTYGRIRPMATNAAILGWLAMGVIGAAYYVVPRLAGRRLWGERWARINLVFGTASIAAGTVAIGLGQSKGLLYFEMPLWADVLVALSLGFAGFVILRTVTPTADSASPSLWFLVGAAVWLPLAFIAAAVPGLHGVNSAIQNWFGFAAFVGLGILAGAVGAAYFLVGKLSGRGWEGTALSRIGFWSFAFVVAWIGPRFLVFGPIPDWLETVGIVFSFVLLVPAAVILSDLAQPMRGRWTDTVAARFLFAGAWAFALVPLHNLLQALRSPSSVIGFTGFGTAFEVLLLFGAAGLWLSALVLDALDANRTLARWQWRFVVTGLVLAIGAMWAAGLQQGLDWLGGANSGVPTVSGEAFISSVEPLEAWYAVFAIGIGLVAIGLAAFVVAIALGRKPQSGSGSEAPAAGSEAPAAGSEAEEPEEQEVPEPAQPIAMEMLVRGSVGLFLLAAVAVFVIPSFEASHRQASLRGETRDFAAGSIEEEGRQLYVSEGCMYCHTQQVRPIATDVGLGPVSQPGDYVFDSPHVLGWSRIGPDLTHAGLREPTNSVRFNLAHLADPRSDEIGRPWSIMPSFDYLSDSELLALAQYIAALN